MSGGGGEMLSPDSDDGSIAIWRAEVGSAEGMPKGFRASFESL